MLHEYSHSDLASDAGAAGRLQPRAPRAPNTGACAAYSARCCVKCKGWRNVLQHKRWCILRREQRGRRAPLQALLQRVEWKIEPAVAHFDSHVLLRCTRALVQRETADAGTVCSAQMLVERSPQELVL